MLVLGLLTLSGLYSAHAQEVLTLEKALNTAFEHSPSLIQSKLSLEQRQLNLKAQDASLKSQFSLDVTPFRYTRNNQYDNFNSKWYANETKMSSASFGITQPIKWTDGTISLYNDFSWQDASNRTSGGNNTSFIICLYVFRSLCSLITGQRCSSKNWNMHSKMPKSVMPSNN